MPTTWTPHFTLTRLIGEPCLGNPEVFYPASRWPVPVHYPGDDRIVEPWRPWCVLVNGGDKALSLSSTFVRLNISFGIEVRYMTM
jgi:hypothetical protein